MEDGGYPYLMYDEKLKQLGHYFWGAITNKLLSLFNS